MSYARPLVLFGLLAVMFMSLQLGSKPPPAQATQASADAPTRRASPQRPRVVRRSQDLPAPQDTAEPPQPDTELQPPLPRSISCPLLADDPDALPAVGTLHSDDALTMHRWDGPVIDGAFHFISPGADGRGRLELPGFGSTEVHWHDGVCLPVALSTGVWVFGEVPGCEHAEGVMVEGCAQEIWLDEQCQFEFELAETCTLQAVRVDGLLFRPGEALSLTPQPGWDLEVSLELPGPVGGLGIGIGLHEQGIAVLKVLEDGPAHALGLEAGDVIVEVEGLETASMELEDFQDEVIGEAGSEVWLVVDREGEELELEAVREVIQ